MPHIEITTAERKRVDDIVRFVRTFSLEGDDRLSVEGRFVLAIEINRLFKPELDELRRQHEAALAIRATGEQ